MNALIPSTSGLTKKQLAFARHYVALGAKNGAATDAAVLAGYSKSGSRKAAAVIASRMLRDPRILQAIRDEADKTLQGAVGVATETLIDLCLSGKPETRLKAATELLDRGGMAKLRTVEHRHHHAFETRTDAELRDYIASMAQQLGLPNPVANVTDAEFEIIDTPQPEDDEVEEAVCEDVPAPADLMADDQPANADALADQLADILAEAEADACLTDEAPMVELEAPAVDAECLNAPESATVEADAVNDSEPDIEPETPVSEPFDANSRRQDLFGRIKQMIS